MKPVVALVGRPNVGKSTLFNRLTRSRDALVSDQPGVTRDRIYGTCALDAREFLLVDTGGLATEAESNVEGLAAEQAWQAVRDADLVVLILDGRVGLNPEDRAIADALRRLGIPVLPVVNKSEGLEHSELAEFHALGLGEALGVSATAGQRLGRLAALAAERLPPAEADADPLPGIRLALVGRPNVGKSTLVNALVGAPRMITYDRPGTTRDAVHTVLERDDHTYTLVDTAGVRRRTRVQESLEKFSAMKAIQAMEAAEVVLLLVDAREGVTDQDARLARLVRDAGRGTILVVNKWDGLDEEEKGRLQRTLDIKLTHNLDYAPMLRISALHGTNVGHLLEAAERVYQAFTVDLSTNRVSQVLNAATTAHPPPFRGGFRPKLRYAHQGGRCPPTFVIHGTRTGTLPANYRRYLERHFREAFDLEGVPVRLAMRTEANPYQGRARHKQPLKGKQGKKGKTGKRSKK